MSEAPESVFECASCGNPFSLPVGSGIGNLGIQINPKGAEMLCRECYLKWRSNPAEFQPAVVRPGAKSEEVLDALHDLGVNVRRHGHLSLDTMDTEDGAAGVRTGKQFVRDVLAAGKWNEVEGLYIYGGTGTGKSQLAVAIIKELLTTGVYRKKDVVYDRARSMVTQLQDRYTTGSVDEFSRIRREAALWVYEDAGTEKHTPDAFRVMEDLFDRREGNPTIITSNLTRTELVKRWSEFDKMGRFRSRLHSYVGVVMGGTDKRSKD